MCNSSLIINSSGLFTDGSLSWFCMCKDRQGTLVIVSMLVLWFIVGTPVHCWFFQVFLCRKIKPNMVFPLNMNIMELLFCIQGFVDFTDFIFSSKASYNLTTFLAGICWTFRPLMQICICIEQYLAVIHPVTFLRYKDMRYRIALVTVAWLIAVGNGFRLASIRMNYFRDHVYFFVFCIVVIITSFCCASVLHALKRPGPGDRNNGEMPEKDKNKTEKRNQQKRKAFRIICTILISILVCYLPIVVVYFLCITGIRAHSFLCDVVPIFLFISKINLLVSPFVRMYYEGLLKNIICFSKCRGQLERN